MLLKTPDKGDFWIRQESLFFSLKQVLFPQGCGQRNWKHYFSASNEVRNRLANKKASVIDIFVRIIEFLRSIKVMRPSHLFFTCLMWCITYNFQLCFAAEEMSCLILVNETVALCQRERWWEKFYWLSLWFVLPTQVRSVKPDHSFTLTFHPAGPVGALSQWADNRLSQQPTGSAS